MKALVALMLCVFLSANALAAEQSRRESVEELLNLMDMDAMLDGMYGQLNQMAAGMGRQMGVQPSEQALFDEFMAEFVGLMREEITWAKMKEPMIDIYLRHYSEEEIQGMLAFYGSDVGQSVIAKMPVVMGESMQISQAMMTDFMPKVQQLAQDFKKRVDQSRAGGQ